jgi:cytochrome c biogenesis protein CcdA/glutaredoxin
MGGESLGARPGIAAAIVLAALAWPVPPAGAAAIEPVQGPPAAATLEVFVREGCPHCEDAKRFLDKLRRERPDLAITVRDIGRDPEARARLFDLVAKTPGAVPAVPAFRANGELLIGFADEETSGTRLRETLARLPPVRAPPAGDDGKCPIGEEPSCTVPTAAPDASSIELPWIGRISLDDVGLPAFTIAIGLLDGLNPCSLWVLVLMVSMLATVGDRRRMIAIAGTFVAIQGIAYFAFMAAWLNLFLLIGISRPSEIVLGAIALVAGLIHVKDFFAFGRGISLSIPDKAKPGLFKRMRALINERSLAVAIGGTVILGVLVQLIELLCTSGLPALYTRILTLRQLDPWSYYGYLLLYITMYMLDDVILLAIGVVTLSQKRMQEKEGRVLKLVSGAVMVLLGVYLIGFSG